MILDRTLHPDEANQAFTVGRLVETGNYVYRPTDHHGPTLYYAAAPLQQAWGHTSTASLDGNLLRATPLVFAILALALLFRAVRRLTGSILLAVAAALLLGTAPIFVFFATDFIQEMLLLAFLMAMYAFGADYLLACRRRLEEPANPALRRPRGIKPGTWALLFGISAALAFATKETSAISFGAALLAGLPFCLWLRRLPAAQVRAQFRPNDLILAIVGFLLVSITLFSSFGTNWQGVLNAFVAAPLSYFHRAAGDLASEGAAWHVHPWWQYFDWLFRHRPFDEFQLLLVPLMLVPFTLFAAYVTRRRRRPPTAYFDLRPDAPPPPPLPLWLFPLLYTIFLVGVYCAIPYKTPWCALQFLPPLVLVAVFALSSQCRKLGFPRWASVGWIVTVTALVVGCRAEALRLMWREPDSRSIPFNYAGASPEVQQLAETVHQALASAPDGFAAVALPAADTWPFPWYNRQHESSTGYWTKFEDLLTLRRAGKLPTVIVVPLAEGHLAQAHFPELAHTRRFYIRPGVRVRVFWK